MISAHRDDGYEYAIGMGQSRSYDQYGLLLRKPYITTNHYESPTKQGPIPSDSSNEAYGPNLGP